MLLPNATPSSSIGRSVNIMVVIHETDWANGLNCQIGNTDDRVHNLGPEECVQLLSRLPTFHNYTLYAHVVPSYSRIGTFQSLFRPYFCCIKVLSALRVWQILSRTRTLDRIAYFTHPSSWRHNRDTKNIMKSFGSTQFIYCLLTTLWSRI